VDSEPQRGIESSACVIPCRGRDVSLHRGLFLLLLLVLPAIYILYQAFWDENSSFLPFQNKAEWVFHPVQKIEDAFHQPVSRPVAFHLDFQIAEDLETMAPYPLQLLAFRSIDEVRVNGKEVPAEKGSFWKQSARVDP